MKHMNLDVIFLAFGHNQSSPLDTLNEEDDKIFRILINRALKGHFFLHRESYANLKKITYFLREHKDRLSMFMYSGHADHQNLQLDQELANSRGLAHQLGECAKNGKLKLVILNGCSTVGHVDNLLNAGVPVVIATNASVDDRSATEFSIHFFRALTEQRLSIHDAFEQALGPAQTVTQKNLNILQIPRGVSTIKNSDDKVPIWGLYSLAKKYIDSNPIPYLQTIINDQYFEPNEKLTDILFSNLSINNCRPIVELKNREEDGEYVEIGDKQTAIVNVLPFPVATHLQKLLCPIEQENEGFDKVSLRRLEQITKVYRTTLEFVTAILLSELWEQKLNGSIKELPPSLIQLLNQYFYLKPKKKISFDFLPMIIEITYYLNKIHKENGTTYFVEEISFLQNDLKKEQPLANACRYIYLLEQHLSNNKVSGKDIQELCEEAEDKLGVFLSSWFFLHRYNLTSVQNIDIQKYRHNKNPTFNHETIKLMRAFGKPELHYYLLSDYLDNRGVALIKGKMKPVNHKKKMFTGEKLEALNLSPFVIDRNAFEEDTDLSNLLFLDKYLKQDNCFQYKSVKRPESIRDRLEVKSDNAFEVVFDQLNAFRVMILNEQP